ncbi:MAG: hypothetical protein LC130_33390 [Bryobacterales bacterium]|nr:hypothetical protein [Bryobacterales bacterium]
MAKKEGRVMDFGVRLRGDLAEVFERERRKEGAQKAAMVRTLVVEALRARGYKDVKDEVEWGGYRPPKVEDESEGQPAAVSVR